VTSLIPSERIEQSILLIRGHKVMLDTDLAQLYGVPTKVLNQAVKRNKNRFPPDFMFQLTEAEKDEVVTVCDHLRRLRFSPSLPHAFTEYGAIMLATVLNSQRAIEASIYVVRAFVRLREALATHRAVARKLAELEKRIESHDEHIQSLFHAIRQLMTSPEPKKRKIGFLVRERAAKYGRAEIRPRR